MVKSRIKGKSRGDAQNKRCRIKQNITSTKYCMYQSRWGCGVAMQICVHLCVFVFFFLSVCMCLCKHLPCIGNTLHDSFISPHCYAGVLWGDDDWGGNGVRRSSHIYHPQKRTKKKKKSAADLIKPAHQPDKANWAWQDLYTDTDNQSLSSACYNPTINTSVFTLDPFSGPHSILLSKVLALVLEAIM